MESRGNVLITGTSTGIGRATALHLDQLGFRVFACVRKVSDGDALRAKASEKLTPIMMDVTDAQAIADAKAQVCRSIGDAGLAGLVNNAGTGFTAPLEFAPLDSLRQVFEVNVFGLLAVTQAFLPLVRQARGRIVNISSSAAILVAPFHGPYSSSKYCVNALSDALRRELWPLGVQVSVVLPGSIDTPLWQKGEELSQQLYDDLPVQANEVYGRAYAKLRKYFDGMARSGIPPEEVARVVAHALTAKRARQYYVVGKDAQRVQRLTRLIPQRFHDRLLLRELGIEG